MNSPDENGSLEQDQLIDEACDRFEDALRRGERPELEDIVREAGFDPSTAEARLVRELLRLEAEYREVAKPEATATGTFTPTISIPKSAARTAPVLAGYTVLGELGRGGMGVVYKAREEGLNRLVALKMLDRGLIVRREAERLRFEAEAAARLDHPNIVPVYSVGEEEGTPFFSMKLVEGGTLASRMAELRKSPREAARILAKVARALQHAHNRGVIHRDLKPGNILLDAIAEPHVADFGLARREDASASLNLSGVVAGTASYMAPEQARGESGLTTSVDIYALGAIIYELLTGRPPFVAESVFETLRQVGDPVLEPLSPRQVAPDAHPDLAAVCQRCLHKNRRDRYRSAQEVAEELERFARGDPVLARATGTLGELAAAFNTRAVIRSEDNWSGAAIAGSAIIIVTHAAIFGLVHFDAPTPVLWMILITYWWLLGLPRWRMIRRFRSLIPEDRVSLAIWVGYLFSSIALFVAIGPIRVSDPVRGVLNWYPAMTALAGVPIFLTGVTFSGRYYVVAFGYFVLAVLLRFWPETGPIAFGLYHSAVLGAVGLAVRCRFLNEEVARRPTHDSEAT